MLSLLKFLSLVKKKTKQKIYNISKKAGDRFGFDLPYFVENGFWVILAQVVNMASSLAMSVVFARYLSKETFGEYQLVLSFMGIFAIISYTGLNTSIMRSAAKGFDFSYVKAVNFSLKKSLIAIPLFLGLAGWYYYQGKTELSLVFIASGLLFSFIHAYSKWAAYLNGKEKFEKVAKKQMIQNITLNILLVVSAVFFSENLLVITGTYLLINASFHTFWHFSTKNSISNRKIDNDCIPYGRYMTKIGFFSSLISHFDKIIIGFINIEMLAVYSIALNLFDVTKQILKSFYSISAPKFAKNNINIEKKKIYILLCAGIAVSAALYFVSKPVIVYFYTNSYEATADIFQKLIFVLPFVFVSPLFGYKVNAQKDKQRIIKAFIFAPVLAIISSVFIFVFSGSTEYFVLTRVYVYQLSIFFILVPVFKK